MKKNLLLVIVLLLVGGCGSKGPVSTMYVRDGLDLGYVKKVAVLPFDNLTENKFIGQRVRDIAMTEVMASNKFEVVAKGTVDTALHEMAFDNASLLDAPKLKILGNRLGVDAFFAGVVNNVEGGAKGAYQYAEISLTLHMIDSETGQVLWRSTAYRNGYSLWSRLFDLDPKDEFELTLELLQEMVAAIPK